MKNDRPWYLVGQVLLNEPWSDNDLVDDEGGAYLPASSDLPGEAGTIVATLYDPAKASEPQ